METEQKIPFIKAVRVENFKIWRSNYVIAKGEDKEAIECIHISNLDGSWMVRIPATFEMFGMLTAIYNDYCSEDPETKSKGEIIMRTLLSNMAYATSIGNGYFHRALELVTTAYALPSLLDKKYRKGLIKDFKSLVKEYLQWRTLYDFAREPDDAEERDKLDELALVASETADEVKEEGED